MPQDVHQHIKLTREAFVFASQCKCKAQSITLLSMPVQPLFLVLPCQCLASYQQKLGLNIFGHDSTQRS